MLFDITTGTSHPRSACSGIDQFAVRLSNRPGDILPGKSQHVCRCIDSDNLAPGDCQQNSWE